MANKLNIAELDFDAIVLALKDYLRSQSEFTDYDFEGSGLSVITRLLAYNTHYLSYYLNMIANEMYLDSAEQRESIVSIAKQLGYTPRSRHAATAKVNLTITPTPTPPPPASITIDRGTKFNTSRDGKNYTFVTTQAYTVNYDESNNRYVASDVTLREGKLFTHRYTVNTTTPERYLIPNAGVDTNTVIVRVKDNIGSSTITTYSLANDITELNGNSTVYFIQEVEEGKYEVYFGDGVIGKELENGNVVYIDYLVCNADQPNYCKIFTPAAQVGGYSSVVVALVDAAFGGAEREDVESIRFAAPKNYEAQNRAVTVEDYKTILTRDYPNVDSVAVWGGENEDPPQYGKVFLSLKPVSGFVVTENTKGTIIKDVLKRRNIVSIIPVIKDPEYIFIKVNSLVKFDAENTVRTADQIKQLVIDEILNFGTDSIGKFDRILRYSKLTRRIDAVELAITNNLTTIQMEKRFKPRLGSVDDYKLQFGNAFVPGTLTSGAFVDTLDPSFVSGDKYYFDDNGSGILRVYKFIGTTRKYTKPSAGTVDYTTGTITLTKFKPQDVLDTNKELRITVNPLTNDIIPVRNNIIIIEGSDVTVNMQANSPILV
jgi:hypothetical protein